MRSVSNTKLPEFLYKYRSLTPNSKSREDVEHILVHGEIRVSSPAWFNDPFDCKLSPLIEGSQADKEKWLEESYVPTLCPALNREKIRKKVAMLLPSVDQLISEHLAVMQNQLIPNSGVLCLCAVQNDILMWSHYADSHRGICLRFRHFTEAIRVDYRTSYPDISLFRNTQEAWSKCVLTKSKHWAYEKEWRLIKPPVEEGNAWGWQKLPAKSLTGIIFGCAISSKDENQILEWMRLGNVQVPLLRAEKKPNRFQVRISEIV